jgi:uncharacterized Zn-binding protein involved in type VI secretion
MGSPIAREQDLIVGVDTHVIMIPSPGGPVPTPLPHPFSGPLTEELSTTAFIDNRAVALEGSAANNTPPHIPMGGPFQKSPANKGTVSKGSTTVFVDGKGVARAGDPAKCCNDPTDQDTGVVIGTSSVFAE